MRIRVTNRSEEQARLDLAYIQEALRAISVAEQTDSPQLFYGEELTADDLRDALLSWPLSINIQGEKALGGEWVATDYVILLCTGGPDCRITGSLEDNCPASASLEYHDWFSPWTSLVLSSEEEKDLLAFTRSFGFEL